MFNEQVRSEALNIFWSCFSEQEITTAEQSLSEEAKKHPVIIGILQRRRERNREIVEWIAKRNMPEARLVRERKRQHPNSKEAKSKYDRKYWITKSYGNHPDLIEATQLLATINKKIRELHEEYNI